MDVVTWITILSVVRFGVVVLVAFSAFCGIFGASLSSVFFFFFFVFHFFMVFPLSVFCEWVMLHTVGPW